MQICGSLTHITYDILSHDIHINCDIRDELTVQNGLIFKGERVIIPKTLRSDMIRRIHSSHNGVEGCLRRVRESLYWPGLKSEVKDFILRCEKCPTLLKPKIEGQNVQKEIQYSKERQAHYYNQGAKELSYLKEGDVVRVKPANKYQKTWEKGTVNQKVNERSYEINIKGKTFSRNRRQLLKTSENIKPGEEEQFNSESNEFEEDEQFGHVEQQEKCNNNTIPHQDPQQNTLDNNTTIRTRSGRQIKRPSKFNDFVN
ncbi:unnamed protein product [Mytilus edulis]|uniref:Integrase zinc-binding domain-containing protein n=1 Tax=Mytilus edulis TaxID=6550 RepID=A0A8S3UT20_MYTED|nr:unnamed protein product [Mytilus edulis]